MMVLWPAIRKILYILTAVFTPVLELFKCRWNFEYGFFCVHKSLVFKTICGIQDVTSVNCCFYLPIILVCYIPKKSCWKLSVYISAVFIRPISFFGLRSVLINQFVDYYMTYFFMQLSLFADNCNFRVVIYFLLNLKVRLELHAASVGISSFIKRHVKG